MGIVNATGDSFYAPSRAQGEAAIAAGRRLADEGADLVDVGGESTRPGSEPVAVKEECRRVLPVIEALAGRLSIPISIDTAKPEVAALALGAGATILNDICALRVPGMSEVASRFPLVILMHMRGTSPTTMQDDPRYDDVVAEVKSFLSSRLELSPKAWIDPGIGFGKTLEHNLELLRRLSEFSALAPVLLGASRKSFIGKLLGTAGKPLPSDDCLPGSLAAACRAAEAGAACVRVHDVKETVRVLDAWKAMR